MICEREYLYANTEEKGIYIPQNDMCLYLGRAEERAQCGVIINLRFVRAVI